MRLTANGISCVRGGRKLYDGLSFSLTGGELLLLSGANGAGKTSLLRQVAGLLPLSGGEIGFEGGDLAEETHFVGHASGIKDTLSVAENLHFWCALYGSADAATEDALARLKLAPLAMLPARVLSAGQKRRLALSRLLAIRRAIWLLDEPDAALDAEGRETLLSIIAGYRARGGIVIVASHAALDLAPSKEIVLGAAAETAAA
ncbi:MAG: heme ABC exporter ATP-binding protein CcmA [Xanthobacteraceae bacterium]|nr:heme ABC exporter ATP-binding protein CcmA [Xanthobacteraceae bacterium]